MRRIHSRVSISLVTIHFVLFVISPARAQSKSIVPLYDKSTVLEPAIVEDTPTALITRIADRVRDRHAREAEFKAYDHYLPLYWENRTVHLEIIDRVAKGGDSITFNMTSLAPLNQPNLRLFFEGKGTVAQYSNNLTSKQIDPLHYTATVKVNTNERRPLKIGDRIEIEFSPFLKPPVKGRTNYYGTALLYVVGQGGMVPWEGQGPRNDSFPLPESAWLGGRTTLHVQYSAEPKEHFKQIPTNFAPASAQPFMLGRRLHHTDFSTGAHSEPGNPIYEEQVGKLGSHFVNRSCVGCHTNNGRAMPPAVGGALHQYLVRVGSDALGTPHPDLGATLQSQAAKGLVPEATVILAGWTKTDGTYGDGTTFSLQKPIYKFSGLTPEFYSVRIAPPLVGQGLLEAIDQGSVAILADGGTGQMRTVIDPETKQPRLGRFGWRASQPRVKHQIASALNNDMGIPTAIFPKLDRGANQAELKTGKELTAADLDTLVRYIATLGVPPRRNFREADVVRGETLFASAQCVKCHTATMTTSPYHPQAELRGQTIHPFTDMLLHDMGPGLADNMGEGTVTGAQWRTTPLWGIGLTSRVSGGKESYLHDGRARDLSEAILWHGGDGEAAREAFRTMPAADRAALVKFLQSL